MEIKILVKIKSKDIELQLTPDEARELFLELEKVAGDAQNFEHPYQRLETPYEPASPWAPPVFPTTPVAPWYQPTIITC